jgi:Zn-dependent protease with chaperone function
MEKKFARKLPTEDRPSTLEGQLAQSREQLYENFSDDMIDGSIAHELGHLVEPPNQISPQMTNLINRITLLAILTIGIIGSLKLCLAGIILFSFYLIYKETDHIKHIQKSEFLADQFSAQIPRYRQGLIQVFTKFQTHFNLLKQAEAHHLRLEKKEINELQAHAYRNILHTTKRAFLKLFNVNFEEEENLIDHPTYAERIYNL